MTNRKELIGQLRDELKGDQTDIPIVATSFDRWGIGAFHKWVGDWALSVWNPKEKKLFLARDYMGVRHLFYYTTSKGVTWSNHLSTLARCGDTFRLSEEYIAGYFGPEPQSDLTPYQDIYSVAAGGFVCISEQSVQKYRYWSFSPRLKTRYKTDQEYEEHFRYLFRQSVARRLRTDSPILAELSGGLDSSSIVCMADEINAQAGSRRSPIDTFSVFDPDEPEDDDFSYITRVEEKRGRVGHHVKIQSLGDSFVIENPPFAAAPGFCLRKEADTAQQAIVRKGRYRVLLCGDGGDDVLGQGRDPRIQMADLMATLKLANLTKLLFAWSLSAKQPWIRVFWHSLLSLVPMPFRSRLQRVKSVPWLSSHFAHKYNIAERFVPGAQGKMLWLPTVRESFQLLRELADRTSSMAPAIIDKRYPFLDQNLVEFLTSIPVEQLLRPAERRSLLRRALVGIVPADILSRRTKSSASRCYVLLVRKHWNLLDEMLRSSVTVQHGYTDANGFRESLLEMKNGRMPPYTVQLLRALSLELWLRDSIARTIIQSPTSTPVGRQSKRAVQLCIDT